MTEKGNPLEIIEGKVQFICEDPPHSEAKPRKLTVKKDSSNEFVVGSKLFESLGSSKAISISHASLSFKGTKLYITDLGSSTGTWISTVGALEMKKVYPLEDGKTIVFGAKGNKTDKTPDAIRVKTKILRFKTKTKPGLKVTFTTSDHDTLRVPSNVRPRAVTPDTLSLKPPKPVVKHRRTISLETPSHKERVPSVQPAKAIATTELPW